MRCDLHVHTESGMREGSLRLDLEVRNAGKVMRAEVDSFLENPQSPEGRFGIAGLPEFGMAASCAVSAPSASTRQALAVMLWSGLLHDALHQGGGRASLPRKTGVIS